MPLSLFFSLLFHVSRVFDKRFCSWNETVPNQSNLKCERIIWSKVTWIKQCLWEMRMLLQFLCAFWDFKHCTCISYYTYSMLCALHTHSHCSSRRLSIISIVAGVAASSLCLLSISLPNSISFSLPYVPSYFVTLLFISQRIVKYLRKYLKNHASFVLRL